MHRVCLKQKMASHEVNDKTKLPIPRQLADDGYEHFSIMCVNHAFLPLTVNFETLKLQKTEDFFIPILLFDHSI